MSTDAIPNVLSARYASARMNEIWSPEHKVVLERELWLAVLHNSKKASPELLQLAKNIPPILGKCTRRRLLLVNA